jgi:hypothetical protein
MTLKAINPVMGGCFPLLIKGGHEMADSAILGGLEHHLFCIKIDTKNYSNKYDTNNYESLFAHFSPILKSHPCIKVIRAGR